MLSLAELATEICTLAGHINAANHRFLMLVAEFDRRQGWSDSSTQSCAHWLNWKCGVAMGAAREKVRVARALEHLPRIAAAMASGTLSYSKAREITRVGNSGNEEYLLMIAEHGTAAHVENLVRAYRRCQEAEELSREQRQQQSRRVSFRYDDDGSLILTCHLPAEAGAMVMKALDIAVEGLPVHEDVPAGTSPQIVPYSARRADALARVAESFLAHDVLEAPGTDRRQIVVHVAAETLRTRAAGCCEIEHGPSIAAETARRFACDASVVSLVEDEDGEPLNVGRKTRIISAPLRRLLTARDKGCRFPGCCNARYIDMHHIKHWANGGETKPSNLVSLCRFHHRAVHECGFDVVILDDGALRFVRPDGEAVDRVLPGCSQPAGDSRQLPAGKFRDACVARRSSRSRSGCGFADPQDASDKGRSSGNVGQPPTGLTQTHGASISVITLSSAGTLSFNRRCVLTEGAMKHFLLAATAAWLLGSATASEPAPLSPNSNINLWPGPAPGAVGNGPLDTPFLTVFTPRAGTANGSAVIIAPGGGNIMLMYGGEGAEVAEVFNDWGVTAFVLTYRLAPRYDNDTRIREGERSLRLVRAHASQWNLDPAKIGFIGFSAGGSLARAVVTASDAGDANAADPIERVSSRPDYTALIYGAGRASEGESLKDYPPTFLLSAAGDQAPSLANAQLFIDLTKAGAVAELHVYQKGRHGFGSGVGSTEFGDWMPRLQGFLRVGGFLPAASTAAPAPTRAAALASKTINDGYGDFVYVPAGTFKMGDDSVDALAREKPAHTVHLDAYYISKHEITNRLWRQFRDDPGYDDPKFWPNGHVVPRDQIPYWTQANNHGGGTPGSDDYPVIGVNWDAATAYCAWLTAKTGKRYRLPTEAEWEKAARGTDGRRYPFGNTIERSQANYVYSQSFDTVKPVGSYPSGASPYGALDMAGNALEWTQDWYDRDYYRASPRKNPQGPATGAYRVVRGGSFFVEAFDLRTTARFMAWPSFQAYRMIGIRPVREP